MRNAVLSLTLALLVGILIGSLMPPVQPLAWVRDFPGLSTLILEAWEGPGAREGLYYDRIGAQVEPHRPYDFWECRALGRYGANPPAAGLPRPPAGKR